MKPKTKKIIIIAAAIAVVAAIAWLAFSFFRKAPEGTAEGYIDRLKDVDRATKRSIKSYLEKAKLEQNIEANATANGVNYEQALALTAAYYLVPGTIDDATWQAWKAQIKAM